MIAADIIHLVFFMGWMCLIVPNTKEEKGKSKQSARSTLLEALAKAIEGKNEEEVLRLAAELNDAYGHLARTTGEVEAVRRGENDSQSEQRPHGKTKRGTKLGGRKVRGGDLHSVQTTHTSQDDATAGRGKVVMLSSS